MLVMPAKEERIAPGDESPNQMRDMMLEVGKEKDE